MLGPGLTYREQWFADRSAIVELTVMVRPMKGLATLVEHIAAELQRT